MHRWATFFLFLLLLLVPHQPVVAKSTPFATEQTYPFSAEKDPSSGFSPALCPQVTTAINSAAFADERCLAGNALATLSDLVQAADLIVRGQVTAIHSFWSADQRLIESDVTIAVTYKLLGEPRQRVTIRTPGGFLAAEGLGMASMHAAAFTIGEEVLAFVYQQDDTWRMVGGATGKFLLQQNRVLNQDLAFAQPLDGLLPTVIELIRKRGLQAQVPVFWRHVTAATPAAPLAALTTAADKRKWATPHATASFALNLNTAQISAEEGNRAAFQQAIVAAAASWSQVPNADFTLTYAGETSATQTGYNGVNEVLFMHKGRQERAAAAQVWYTADGTIVEADIWINDDYTWSATGRPAVDAVDLQSALLHEFGHWLILGHFADQQAVMFAKLATGALKRDLQQADMQGISAIYPR